MQQDHLGASYTQKCTGTTRCLLIADIWDGDQAHVHVYDKPCGWFDMLGVIQEMAIFKKFFATLGRKC